MNVMSPIIMTTWREPKMSVEMSAALKANANLTYRDVVKINRFQNKNTPE